MREIAGLGGWIPVSFGRPSEASCRRFNGVWPCTLTFPIPSPAPPPLAPRDQQEEEEEEEPISIPSR